MEDKKLYIILGGSVAQMEMPAILEMMEFLSQFVENDRMEKAVLRLQPMHLVPKDANTC